MTDAGFTPFGSELDARPFPKFVEHGEKTSAPTNPQAAPAPVTPAEAVDLPGEIREILQGQLAEAALDSAVNAIAAAVNNAPTRVALPEIKLNTGGDQPSLDGQPTIEFEREGDTVKRVQVHCACGQSIHLDCVY
tara:strand:- start:32 stop:436 length:405 start_codon:yes stop_codon:yes gene_type:complete